MSKVKEYSNGEVTVFWKPELCIHSENCVKGLPSVFDPNAKPWVNVEAAKTGEIVIQVKKCPSAALSYIMEGEESDRDELQGEQIVEITKDGPLMVYGDISVKHPDGTKTSKHKATAFCRCGASQNKPYCDGSHKKIEFKG